MTVIQNILNRERFTRDVGEVGIGGYTIFARVNERFSLTAQSPTHYVEDGTSLNDHRTRNPELLTLNGVIGDIYSAPNSFVERVTALNDDLGLITSYQPVLSEPQQQLYDQIRANAESRIERLERVLNSGVQANRILGNLDTNTRPLVQQFIEAMEAIHYSSQLISIDMPFRTYKQMSVEDFTYDRDNTSNGISFTLTAKRMRIADLDFVNVERVTTRSGETVERIATNPAAALDGQGEEVTNKGTQEGRQVSEEQTQSLIAGFLF